MITPKPHNTAEEYPIATLLIKETITRKPYETDPTDDEWAIPKLILQRALYGDKTKTRGHPRHYPLREIVNAILYALKTGCPRRQLPHDLPDKGTSLRFTSRRKTQNFTIYTQHTTPTLHHQRHQPQQQHTRTPTTPVP